MKFTAPHPQSLYGGFGTVQFSSFMGSGQILPALQLLGAHFASSSMFLAAVVAGK